ncbi:hypothetical protein IW262DRAFT_1465471 [Armillaria fumosa]|nr:hypothetical protein IW262DRAFT_1465471 [Armillaria fumosa]
MQPDRAKRFLGEFLPKAVANIPDTKGDTFQKIIEKTTETAMYGPLIDALTPFCASLQFLDTHATPDPQSSVFNPDLLKPDISVYKAENTINLVTQFSLMETHCIELKLCAADGAFSDEGDFKDDSLLCHDTRGQLVSYANAQMASQYRTHLFTVFICADGARLLRWDRAVTITRLFQYSSSDTPYLQEFFWRFSHANDTTRGLDTSVMDPGPDEEVKARRNLKVDDSEMLFKFTVYDDCDPDTDPTYLIAGPPFETHAFPTGRATRCFVAYHLTQGRNVFIKDTWRIVTPGLVAEGRVYERLRDSEIPHVAKFIVTGDVPGQTHRTFSRPHQRLHQHYRLVLGTIGRPLTSFRSSWGMLNAIKDGMSNRLPSSQL